MTTEERDRRMAMLRAAQPYTSEEMLMHMQELCTPRKADLVQMILNFIKAGHLFQNYRDFMAQQGPDENPDLHAAGFSSPSANPLQMLLQLMGGFGGVGSSNHLMEFLITQLSPEQQQLFEQLKSFTQSSGEEKEADYGACQTENDRATCRFPAGKKINRGTSSADAVETDDAAGKYSVYGGRKSDIDRNLFCAALTAAEKTI